METDQLIEQVCDHSLPSRARRAAILQLAIEISGHENTLLLNRLISERHTADIVIYFIEKSAPEPNTETEDLLWSECGNGDGVARVRFSLLARLFGVSVLPALVVRAKAEPDLTAISCVKAIASLCAESGTTALREIFESATDPDLKCLTGAYLLRCGDMEVVADTERLTSDHSGDLKSSFRQFSFAFALSELCLRRSVSARRILDRMLAEDAIVPHLITITIVKELGEATGATEWDERGRSLIRDWIRSE